MTPYSFHPEAEAEFSGAALFYESRMVGLGKSFAAEVERTVSLIREHPDAGAPLVGAEAELGRDWKQARANRPLRRIAPLE